MIWYNLVSMSVDEIEVVKWKKEELSLGKNVLIDGILVEREEIKPHYRQLIEILKDKSE